MMSWGREGEGKGRTSEMARDVVAFCAAGAAVSPLASETEIVCRLSADVFVAEMVVEQLWVGESVGAAVPFAEERVRGHRGRC